MKISTTREFLLWAKYVLDYLKKEGVKYWIDYGTLLGAVRDGNIIPWDKDMDVGVYHHDLNKIGSIVQHHHASGIPHTSTFQVWDNPLYRWGLCRIAPKNLPDNRETKLQFIDLYFVKEGGEQFDYKFDDWIGSTTKSDLVYPDGMNRDLKKYYVYETDTYFLDGIEFDGPRYPEKLLDYRYGSRDEWEIPNQGYYKKYNMNEILKPESLHGKELREKFLPLREGKIRCFFPGTWDLFHVGHLRQLQRASEIYDYVTVGIHSDESVESYKRKPIISCSERTELISGLECVDDVIVGTTPTTYFDPGFFESNKIDYVVAGKLLESEKERNENWNVFDLGDKLHWYDRIDGVSTSEIIERIQVM